MYVTCRWGRGGGQGAHLASMGALGVSLISGGNTRYSSRGMVSRVKTPGTMPASAQVPQLIVWPRASAARFTARGLAAIAVMNIADETVVAWKHTCSHGGLCSYDKRMPALAAYVLSGGSVCVAHIVDISKAGAVDVLDKSIRLLRESLSGCTSCMTLAEGRWTVARHACIGYGFTELRFMERCTWMTCIGTTLGSKFGGEALYATV